MKIKSITIKNFRSYAAETTIHFDDFTAFVVIFMDCLLRIWLDNRI